MGMSTYVEGFKPADEKWKKMKAAWDACKDAGVDQPSDVDDYFDGEDPGDKPGMVVELDEKTVVKSYSDDDRQGFEVDITKLPKDVTVIRFIISW